MDEHVWKGIHIIQTVAADGDQGTASKDLVQVPIGPVTRTRAKKSRMYSTDSSKSYGLKQIRGGPLSIHVGNKESSP
jgi:hypothetical protein